MAERDRLAPMVEADEVLSDKDQALWREIEETLAFSAPSPDQIAQETKTIASGLAGAASIYWPVALILQTIYALFLGIWDSAVAMLLGMALFKSGFFEGRWRPGAYLALIIVGYLLILPLRATHLLAFVNSGYDLVIMSWNTLWYDVERVGVALAHVSLVMLAIRADFMPLAHRLAAVGRMALTNYLMHSVFALLFFIGLGTYGAFTRIESLGLMLIIWTVQLWYSPLWLKNYRFGPAEWLWRTLTYGKKQPLRKK